MRPAVWANQHKFQQNMASRVCLFLRIGILPPYWLCKEGVGHLFELEGYWFGGDTDDAGQACKTVHTCLLCGCVRRKETTADNEVEDGREDCSDERGEDVLQQPASLQFFITDIPSKRAQRAHLSAEGASKHHDKEQAGLIRDRKRPDKELSLGRWVGRSFRGCGGRPALNYGDNKEN